MFKIFIIALVLPIGAWCSPVINTATNLWVVMPNNAVFACLATNIGNTSITSTWSQVSGPASLVFSNASSTITEAFIPTSGVYSVRITCSDNAGTSVASCTLNTYASPLNLHVMFSGTGSGAVNGKSSNFWYQLQSPSTVTLTAIASGGSTFVEWVGSGYTGTNNPCTVTVDSLKDISAVFDTTGTGTSIYYVATNGNNANPGTLVSPWRNIQYAVSNVIGGAKVIVGSGEFNEFVTAIRSGTNNPIVFEGTRDTNGAWLTVIDPSTRLTNGWIAASEINSNAWKITNVFFPRELTIDSKRVAFAHTLGNLASGTANIYSGVNSCTNGSDMFGVDSNALMTVYGHTMRFWDGLEAVYAATGSGPYTIYLRFRDGSSPNVRNVRASPNRDDVQLEVIYQPAIGVNNGYSNLVFRNFSVRGAFAAVAFGHDGGYANNCTVENCYLFGGYSRAYIGGDGTSGPRSSGCVVRNNEVIDTFYGYPDSGAWEGLVANPAYRYSIRNAMYGTSKFTMGKNDTFDEAVALIFSGTNNVVYGNHIKGWGGEGVYLDSANPPVSPGIGCWDNTIENEASTGFLFNRWLNCGVFDNHILDCDVSFRLGILDWAGETNRVVYFYRNTSWLPSDQVGDHIFYHFNTTTPSGYFPTFWIYNNSFSGGRYGFEWNANALACGGTPNCRMLNNITSGSYSPTAWFPAGFSTNSALVGAFDYNLISPPSGAAAWLGTNNISHTHNEWVNTPAMTFMLTPGSYAINNGLDVYQSFNIRGTNYPALPNDASVKFGTAWDMGALEYSGPPNLGTASSLHVQNLYSQ